MGGDGVTTDRPANELNQQVSAFWTTRPESRPAGTMEVRNEQEQQAWIDALRPLLPSPPADVLDVGTGQGFLALLLADLGHRVVGIDSAEGMLAASRSRAATRTNPPEFRLGDAVGPPLAESSLDVVSNRQVVWTLLDPAAALRTWLGLLRPGGRFLSVHLHQNSPTTGSNYPESVQAALPALSLEPNGPAVVTRFDRNYPDAVANLARETGFVDVTLTQLDTVNRFEEQIGSDRRWLALTGYKPG
jgi:SAM-dependent methyltransferase